MGFKLICPQIIRFTTNRMFISAGNSIQLTFLYLFKLQEPGKFCHYCYVIVVTFYLYLRFVK